jgi:hypothetical protein
MAGRGVAITVLCARLVRGAREGDALSRATRRAASRCQSHSPARPPRGMPARSVWRLHERQGVSAPAHIRDVQLELACTRVPNAETDRLCNVWRTRRFAHGAAQRGPRCCSASRRRRGRSRRRWPEQSSGPAGAVDHARPPRFGVVTALSDSRALGRSPTTGHATALWSPPRRTRCLVPFLIGPHECADHQYCRALSDIHRGRGAALRIEWARRSCLCHALAVAACLERSYHRSQEDGSRLSTPATSRLPGGAWCDYQ